MILKNLSIIFFHKPLRPECELIWTPGSQSVNLRAPYQNNHRLKEVIVGLGYLSPRHRQPAGHKGHLIRPTAPLWCERLSDPFDSPLLSQQEVVGDN